MCSRMRQFCLSLLLLIALLFAVNCDDENNQTSRGDPEVPVVGGGDYGADDDGGDDSVASANKIDILCLYWMSVSPNDDCRKGCVLRDSAQFAAFLDVTRYANRHKGGDEHEMAQEPDFEKWTYLAFTGNAMLLTMGDIVEGEDTVAVGYTKLRAASCEEQAEKYPYRDCRHAGAVPPHADIHYMPFTKKAIKFSESIELYYGDGPF